MRAGVPGTGASTFCFSTFRRAERGVETNQTKIQTLWEEEIYLFAEASKVCVPPEDEPVAATFDMLHPDFEDLRRKRR